MDGRSWPILGMLLCAIAGCVGPFARHGARDGDRDLDIPLVAGLIDGDRERAINGALLQVSGVGLVTGLHGTGDAPQGPWREMLEKELRKQKFEHVRDMIESRDNAIVLVTAMLHGGMRKHDRIDVEVTLPPGSRASSLRGGTLISCPLRNYQKVSSARGDLAAADNVVLAGDLLVRAGGPLQVGLRDDSAAELKRARIWEGGDLLADRPFYFVMKHNDRAAYAANAVAERINSLYRENAGRGDVARPTGEMAALNVPFCYSLNPDRFLRVARLVPMRDAGDRLPSYADKLAKLLLEVKNTQRAAMRLEALGAAELTPPLGSPISAVAILKTGLASPHPLVRFAAAESLTYLGSTDGVEELGKLAQRHRPLRLWALLALASLNESACRNRLADLLAAPEPDLRYGAFTALRLMSRNDPAEADTLIPGEKLGNFWLHAVAPGSPPLVHLSLQKREQVVLFGDGIRLRAPLGIAAGTDFTIRAEGDQCIISRVMVRQENQQRTASLRVDDIVTKMAELGAQYADVVDFLRKADQRGCLGAPLRTDALPEQVELEVLAESIPFSDPEN